MPIPDFNADGDLPPGIYRATMEEVVARFGGQSAARRRCTTNLRHIFQLVTSTGHFERMIIFGSYVSSKVTPNDVDVVLVMSDLFNPASAASESRGLFDHAIAQLRFGASVFWITENVTLGESLDSFLAHWQKKRDGGLRGIVEVVS